MLKRQQNCKKNPINAMVDEDAIHTNIKKPAKWYQLSCDLLSAISQW